MPLRRTFQGPEINRTTGEKSSFVKSVLTLPKAAAHIKTRSSNVSRQSLQLNLRRLHKEIREYSNFLSQNRNGRRGLFQGRMVDVRSMARHLDKLKQELADFMKRHGNRV